MASRLRSRLRRLWNCMSELLLRANFLVFQAGQQSPSLPTWLLVQLPPLGRRTSVQSECEGFVRISRYTAFPADGQWSGYSRHRVQLSEPACPGFLLQTPHPSTSLNGAPILTH